MCLYPQGIRPGYAKRFNVLWPAVDNHLTVGLSDAKPDIVESFRKTDYPPRAVSDLDDALAPSDYDIAMPALAVEVKGFEGSMAVARAQCAYDGALMINRAHTLHKYVGKSDDNFFGTTQALTIAYDGENLHLYGHHVPPPQAVATSSPTVEYHQYTLGRDNPRDSLESFKSACRYMRNAQEIGYNLANERKDILWTYINSAETNGMDDVDEVAKVDGGHPLPVPLYNPMSPPQLSEDILCAAKSQKALVSNSAIAKSSRAIGDSKIRRKSRPALSNSCLRQQVKRKASKSSLTIVGGSNDGFYRLQGWPTSRPESPWSRLQLQYCLPPPTPLLGANWFRSGLQRLELANFKPTEAKPPQSFRDGVVQARVHRDRDRFIASIGNDDVRLLAESYHDGDTCIFFKPPIRGSYNICYFVQFPSRNKDEDGDKWVVRVSLDPCLAFGGRSKLESELATMRLIAEKTTIPIPKIHAYALGDGPEPFPSFLILEYVEGQKLTHADVKKLSEEQRIRLYTSLADIYIQLRRLVFPSIGRLGRGPDGYQVCKRVNMIELNMQELEGLAPSEIQNLYDSAGGTLSSANDYVAILLQIADNAFSRGPGALSQEEGEDHLYHLHMFRQGDCIWGWGQSLCESLQFRNCLCRLGIVFEHCR